MNIRLSVSLRGPGLDYSIIDGAAFPQVTAEEFVSFLAPVLRRAHREIAAQPLPFQIGGPYQIVVGVTRFRYKTRAAKGEG